MPRRVAGAVFRRAAFLRGVEMGGRGSTGRRRSPRAGGGARTGSARSGTGPRGPRSGGGDAGVADRPAGSRDLVVPGAGPAAMASCRTWLSPFVRRAHLSPLRVRYAERNSGERGFGLGACARVVQRVIGRLPWVSAPGVRVARGGLDEVGAARGAVGARSGRGEGPGESACGSMPAGGVTGGRLSARGRAATAAGPPATGGFAGAHRPPRSPGRRDQRAIASALAWPGCRSMARRNAASGLAAAARVQLGDDHAPRSPGRARSTRRR